MSDGLAVLVVAFVFLVGVAAVFFPLAYGIYRLLLWDEVRAHRRRMREIDLALNEQFLRNLDEIDRDFDRRLDAMMEASPA
jgi:hypothetical protein